MSSSYPLSSNHSMRMIWPKLYILFLKIYPFSGLLSVVIECPDFSGWEKRFLGMAKTVWVRLFWEKKTIFAKSVCRICGFKVTLFHPRELVKKYFWLKNIRFAKRSSSAFVRLQGHSFFLPKIASKFFGRKNTIFAKGLLPHLCGYKVTLFFRAPQMGVYKVKWSFF